jgi:hypothetical protein
MRKRMDFRTIACSPISNSRIRLFEKGEAHVRQRKNMRNAVLIACFVFVVAGCGTRAPVAEPQPVSQRAIPYAAGIVWEYVVTPQAIPVGRSARIVLTLSNPTPDPVVVDSDIFGHFSVLIVEASQHQQLGFVASAKPADKMSIAVGDAISTSYLICTAKDQLKNRLGFLVDQKGTYTLQLLNRGILFAETELEVH